MTLTDADTKNLSLASVKPQVKGQPGAFLEAWCRSSGMNVSRTWHKEHCFSHFFWYCDVFEPTFGRWKKSTLAMYFLPGLRPVALNRSRSHVRIVLRHIITKNIHALQS